LSGEALFRPPVLVNDTKKLKRSGFLIFNEELSKALMFCRGSMILADGKLIIRDEREVKCLDLRKH